MTTPEAVTPQTIQALLAGSRRIERRIFAIKFRDAMRKSRFRKVVRAVDEVLARPPYLRARVN